MSETGDRVAPATSGSDVDAARALFREYAASLDFDLCFQDFDAEMADFPGKYAAAAGGALLLAWHDGEPAGAVGLRDLGGGICEMKRLYLRPVVRGGGLGRRLVAAVIEAGRALGYRAMRLDTAPGHHDAAIALYESLGFRDIPPYCFNPIEGARYMELDLNGKE